MIDNNYKVYLIQTNGTYAELDTEGLDFITTFSVTDINDISKRKGTFSKNIVFKDTPNNNRIFGNLFELNRSADTTNTDTLFYNYSAARPVKCIVLEDGVQLFKGFLKVPDYDVDAFGSITYNAIITGSLVNFFGDIQDAVLTDLTAFNTSHTYNMSIITSSWDYNNNQTFIYPNIDYGAGIVHNASKFDIANFRTGIYYKTYLDAIFSHFGYTYESSFIESDIFRRAYIPFSEKDFAREINGKLFYDDTIAEGFFAQSLLSSNAIIADGYSIGFPSNNYIDTATINSTYPGAGNTNEPYPYFRFKRTITTEAEITLIWKSVYTKSTYLDFKLVPVRDGVIEFGTVLDSKSYNFLLVANPTTSEFTVKLKLPFGEYPGGYGFAVIIIASPYGSGTGTIQHTHRGEFVLGRDELINKVQISVGDSITLKDVIPANTKISDFLKSILQMFNLYMVEDKEVENKFIIEPYDSFYQYFNNPKEYAVNWSHKIDYSNGFKGNTNVTIPKKYTFIYKDDTDYYNELYKKKFNEAYGAYSVSDSSGISEEKKIEVSFSPTVVVQYEDDDKIMPVLYKGTPTKKETFKTNLRILFNNGVRSCNNYNVVKTNVNTSGDVVGYTDIQTNLNTYNLSHHLLYSGDTAVFNLQFGYPFQVYAPVGQDIYTVPNIYSTFYHNQFLELRDVNLSVVECDIDLNENDISNLDFRLPIFLQTPYGTGYFKILEVEYYNNKEMSRIKLQKFNKY